MRGSFEAVALVSACFAMEIDGNQPRDKPLPGGTGGGTLGGGMQLTSDHVPPPSFQGGRMQARRFRRRSIGGAIVLLQRR